MTTTEPTVLSRRALLRGGVVGAATLAVAAACGADPPDAVPAGDVLAVRVDRVPVDDPGDEEWERAAEKIVPLGPQDIALPNRSTPSVAEIKVRALHDGRAVAFRIEWADAQIDDLTVAVDEFRDACAVLLAPGSGDPALRTMGSTDQPAVLLHWKADWERDMAQGVQGIAAVYPNRSVDVYPPLIDVAPEDVTPQHYVAGGASQWLPGLGVSNPLSAVQRSSPVEKLVAHGYGTTTTAPHQDASGHGERFRDGWRVVIAKPLASSDEGELGLSAGGEATCAFAIWSGGDGDAGSRKSPSASVYKLVLG
jgi:DMSO reductase family type II enzyme heme b subunit